MMKKLLVLVLVLAMASAANATLQISIDGDPEPTESEYELSPSETIEMDIWTDAAIPPFGQFVWAMVVDTDDGTLSGGAPIWANLPAGTAAAVTGATEDNDSVIPPTGMQGIWGNIANVGSTFTTIAAGTVLFDSIVFHCERMVDATIELYLVTEDVQMSNPIDSVIIHQIPEPATIMLLGLGGLLLRRRK